MIVAMAAYGAKAYISTMYYDTSSATTSSYAIHVIQSQYLMPPSHLWKPQLNR